MHSCRLRIFFRKERTTHMHKLTCDWFVKVHAHRLRLIKSVLKLSIGYVTTPPLTITLRHQKIISNDKYSQIECAQEYMALASLAAIRRSLVMRDLIEEFADVGIMSCSVKIVMVDEQGNDEAGIDTGGVYRDVIGCFLQDVYMSCTNGEDERVPSLRHDFQAREWSAIARILAKGFIDLKYFPYMLSKAFIVSFLFGEESVSEEILINSFKRYLAKDEEKVISDALEGDLNSRREDEEDEENDLIDILGRFDCRNPGDRVEYKEYYFRNRSQGNNPKSKIRGRCVESCSAILFT